MLAAKGGLRVGMSVEMAADVIWVMNSPEFFLLCVRDRGWTADVFEEWLADAWTRLLWPGNALPETGASASTAPRGRC